MLIKKPLGISSSGFQIQLLTLIGLSPFSEIGQLFAKFADLTHEVTLGRYQNKARDGIDLVSYLTIPHGDKSTNLPMVSIDSDRVNCLVEEEGLGFEIQQLKAPPIERVLKRRFKITSKDIRPT